MGHKQLNREKREIIERLLEKRHSIREIALILGYSPSGICQEIRRNSEYQNGTLVYRHQIAQRKTAYRRRRPGNTCKPDILVEYVVDKLRLYWFPEQIEGRLVLDYPSQPNLRVSFKTIYRWIERSKQHISPLGVQSSIYQVPAVQKATQICTKWTNEKSGPSNFAVHQQSTGTGRKENRIWPLGRRPCARLQRGGKRRYNGRNVDRFSGGNALQRQKKRYGFQSDNKCVQQRAVQRD